MRGRIHKASNISIKESSITPRYMDLFQGMLDSDRTRADAAYDSILFERHLAVPALIEQYHLSTDNDILRYLCVQLMGFSDSKMSINTLMIALDDPSSMVRREACFALEDLKATDAIDAIRRRTQDLDSSVRQVAEEAYNFLTKMQKD